MFLSFIILVFILVHNVIF